MSKVNSYIESHADLGPWKQIQQHHHFGKQEEGFRVQGKKMFHLPRMTKKASDMQAKKKGTKYQFDLPMKINPINLQIKKQIQTARKSRTLSFDPPMISFYNKRHPKNQKKAKQEKNDQRYLPTSVNLQKGQKNYVRLVSKIDLLCDEEEQQEKNITPTIKSSQYEYAKKRSLMEVLKFMRNSGINEEYKKKKTPFEFYEQMQEMSLTFRVNKYIPMTKRMLNVKKKM